MDVNEIKNYFSEKYSYSQADFRYEWKKFLIFHLRTNRRVEVLDYENSSIEDLEKYLNRRDYTDDSNEKITCKFCGYSTTKEWLVVEYKDGKEIIIGCEDCKSSVI